MVAPVALQFDVRGLQIIHWQGHAGTGQLPFLMLYQPQPAPPARLQPQSLIGCAAFAVFGQKGESLGWRKVPKAFASGRATMVSGRMGECSRPC